MRSRESIRQDRPAEGVLRITFDREDARNAIDAAMLREFAAMIDEAEHDDSVRVVVLAGAGDKAFSSGYDLKELRGFDPDRLNAAVAEQSEVLWRYLTFPKPTVASLAGVSRGAGTLLAACSDLRVGDSRTDLAVTAVRYGGANLTWLLDLLVGAGPARDLLMTGRSVSGEEALRMGLITRLAADGAVRETAVDVARELAERPADAVRAIKRLALDNVGRTLAGRYEQEGIAARALLRHRSIEETFAGFSVERAGSGAGGLAGEVALDDTGSNRGVEAGSGEHMEIWTPSWEDPFVPTAPASDEFARMMGALTEVQEAATRSVPTPAEAAVFADRLSALAADLRHHEVSEDEQLAGKRWDIAGRGQALIPPLHFVEMTPTSARGHVTVGRFYSGRYAMNGGVTPLIFDELLSRLANGFGRPWARTAYLKVDYRAPAPLERRLSVTAEVTSEEGRKRFVRGAMYDGDTLVAEAEGLWVEIRRDQAINGADGELVGGTARSSS